MALQVRKALRRGLLHEQRVGVRVGGGEGHVHAAAGGRLGLRDVERALVQQVVEQLRFFDVDLLDAFHAALLLQPLHAQARHVDGVGGRGVEHGVLLGHLRPVQHLRADGACVAQQILAHDYQRHACGADVLLRARVDHAEAADVVDLGEDVGGHVGHQRHVARLRKACIAGAEDGVVGGDVDVLRVGIEVRLRQIGNAAVVLLPGGGCAAHAAVLLRLVHGDVGEVATVDVVRAAVFAQQVHGNRRELARRAALQPEHRIGIRDVHQFAGEGHGIVKDLAVHLGTVTHLHHGHAAASVTQHLLRCGAQGFFGHGGGAGCKVVHAIHSSLPFICHHRHSIGSL